MGEERVMARWSAEKVWVPFIGLERKESGRATMAGGPIENISYRKARREKRRGKVQDVKGTGRRLVLLHRRVA
jgi:hypothetical protein